MRSQIKYQQDKKMKKAIFIICTLLTILTFSAETSAIKKEPIRKISNRLATPTHFLQIDDSLDFKPTVLKRITTAPKTEVLPVSSLTVVDSNQVTVKYELWIVKMLKKLFR